MIFWAEKPKPLKSITSSEKWAQLKFTSSLIVLPTSTYCNCCTSWTWTTFPSTLKNNPQIRLRKLIIFQEKNAWRSHWAMGRLSGGRLTRLCGIWASYTSRACLKKTFFIKVTRTLKSRTKLMKSWKLLPIWINKWHFWILCIRITMIRLKKYSSFAKVSGMLSCKHWPRNLRCTVDHTALLENVLHLQISSRVLSSCVS